MSESNHELVLDLLELHQEALDRGENPEPVQLCRNHPELLPQLIACLQDLERCDNLMTASFTPSPHPPITEPRILLGRYRLEGLLGEGGHGQVWRAFDTELQRKVAIKVPKMRRMLAESELSQLLAEARHVAHLHHPGIVAVYDVAREGAGHIVITELVEGTNLEKFMVAGPIPEPEAVAIAARLARILQHSHEQGIIHRDIKPSNLLLEPDGQLRVCDFGIATTTQELPDPPDAHYTLSYASPEQILGQPLDARTDIWSLGVVLFEMVSGTALFGGDHPSDVHDDILSRPTPTITTASIALNTLCHRCLAKYPEDRFSSAADLAMALETLQANLSRNRRRRQMLDIILNVGIFASLAAGVLLLLNASALSGGGPAGSDFTDTGKSRQESPPALPISYPIGCPPLLDCCRAVDPAEMVRLRHAWAEYLEQPARPTLGINGVLMAPFVLIPPGRYIARNPARHQDDQKNIQGQQVVLTRPFYLAQHELTQRQYQSITGINPSWFSSQGGGMQQVAGMDTTDFPVESISQTQALEACEILRKKTGTRFMLPTGAQWEYGRRAGSLGVFHWGDNFTGAEANLEGLMPVASPGSAMRKGRTCQVGSYPPNAFGLHDMEGNVAEWCADRHSDQESGKILVDPFPQEGTIGVLRGNSWLSLVTEARTARRISLGTIPAATGMRLACAID